MLADVLIGADGINSLVREALWGFQPIREQNLHLVGGYVLLDGEQPAEGVIAHDRDTQGSYTAIRHEGRGGYQWWVLRAWPHDEPFTEDLASYARRLAAPFGEPLVGLVAQTAPENLQRWPIRDRKPLKQWSKGRTTLLGDAAHPTSPYAAYGAGMSIEDGYFLARELSAIDLGDTGQVRQALQAYEDRRKPHTAKMSQLAYYNGMLFHHLPRVLHRSATWSSTTLRFCRRSSAIRCPATSSRNWLTSKTPGRARRSASRAEGSRHVAASSGYKEVGRLGSSGGLRPAKRASVMTHINKERSIGDGGGVSR